jgi:hypothetical protein
MDVRDYTRLAQALAKASLHSGVDAASVEECIYQIGHVLARDDQRFDVEAWQREIREWRVALSAVIGTEIYSEPSRDVSARIGPGA